MWMIHEKKKPWLIKILLQELRKRDYLRRDIRWLKSYDALGAVIEVLLFKLASLSSVKYSHWAKWSSNWFW